MSSFELRAKRLNQSRISLSGEIFEFKASLITQMKRSKSEEKTRVLNVAYAALTDAELKVKELREIIKPLESL